MSKRTWILGKQQKFVPGRPAMREVLETDPAGHQRVLLVVAEVCAVDVLEALRTTYQNGREDALPSPDVIRGDGWTQAARLRGDAL